MIRRWLAPICALVGMALVVNCAQGGSRLNGGDDDDDPVKPDGAKQPDAAENPPTDGLPPADASPPDAAVLPPDATPDAPVQQLFCTDNNQCTVAGECCLTLGGPQGFCVPGTVVVGVCFPAE